jgi:WD40 repeat protein
VVPKEDDDVGSARTAAPVATAETVATTPPDAAHSATLSADAAHSATMTSSSSLDAIGDITPESLGVVSPQVYIQLDEFARGGLGRIIRAKDTRTGRIVAIKEMLLSTEDAALRFAREAMITANLQHPAIVPVYEVGRWTSGQPFYAMKLVSGRPLDQVIAATKTIDDRLALVSHVLAVADALAYAHGERVIHRDLKPHNVLVGAHGETVVIDWGLARRLDDKDPAASHRVISAVPGQTYLGAVMGTPAYMPPEQARGVRVDERADVYAIGAILYHLLAGKAPYAGKTLDELLSKVKAGSIEKLTSVDPSIPADLAAIVERAMARDAVDRYESAAELAADLRRFTTGQLVQAHQYTRMQRIGRFVARNRAAVAIASVAIVAGAIGGTIAVRNVMSARDDATSEAKRAEQARDVAHQRLVEAHVDRARSELAASHDDLALAFAIAAAKESGLDDRLRFIAGRALASQVNVARLADDGVQSILPISGSADVIVSSNTGLRRWDPISRKVLWERMDGTFSGDATMLDDTTAVVARERGAEVFDISSGKVLATLQTTPPRKFQGLMGVDPSKRWFAAPLHGGEVALFDLSTRTLNTVIPAVLVDGTPLVGPDGKKFVFLGAITPIQSRLYLMNRDGTGLQELCGNCTKREVLGDDIIVAEASTNLPARIRIFDWSGTQEHELMATTTGAVADLVGFPDGERFALALADGTVEVHHRRNGLEWRHATGDRTMNIDLDAQGRLWVLGNYKHVSAFDAKTGLAVGRWFVPGAGVWVSPDGKRVTTLNPGRGAYSFELTASAIPVAPSSARVRKIVFLPDGRLVTGSEDGLVAIVEPGKSDRELVRLDAKVMSLQLVDGRLLVSSKGYKTHLIDLDGKQIASTDVGGIAAAAPDGTILIGGPLGSVYLWNGKDAPKAIAKFDAAIAAVRWTDDGMKFGAIDEQSALEVFTRDGTSVRKIPPSNTFGLDLRFSKRGTHVTRSFDNEGRDTIYGVAPGAADIVLDEVVHDRHYSVTFTFSQDDSAVVMAGTGFLAMWDLPSGKLRHVLGKTTDTIATIFSKDERFAFSGSIDRLARVWDIESGLEVASIAATNEVYGLALSPDGNRLAVLTLGAALVWDITPFSGDVAELERLAACRIEIAVVDGTVVRRTIDVAACNAQR